MYDTQTQFAQQSTNDQQAKNAARRTRFQGQASQGQYPFAQQGSQQAQQSGAAAQGAQMTNQAKAPAPQPTFAQLQAQGMARPAPPPAPAAAPAAPAQGVQQAMVPMLTGQQVQPTGNAVPFTGQNQQPGQASPAFGAAQGQTALTSDVQTALGQMLANPSAYNTDAVLGTYQRLAGQIDDDFNLRDTKINEEMARRGIYDSSIAAGRLADSNIARRSASVELADRLAQQQAEKFDQARQAALGLGLTNQGQMQQQSQFDSRLAQDATQFTQDLGYRRDALAQNDRQFDRTQAQNDRQFDADLGYRRDSLAQNDRQFGSEFAQRQYEFDAGQGYKYNELAQNGNLDLLRLLGVDVVDYGAPAGTAQWQGDDPVTR